jgi:hypothetical protein
MDTTSVPCPLCGKPAQRESVYYDQYIFGETCAKNQRKTPQDRVNLSNYMEASQEVAYHYDKFEKETGEPVPRPDLWNKAKKRAKILEKAGVTATEFKKRRGT